MGAKLSAATHVIVARLMGNLVMKLAVPILVEAGRTLLLIVACVSLFSTGDTYKLEIETPT